MTWDGATSSRPVLITGGAGFVGCNLADALLNSGRSVILYDNLSRPGVEQNAAWLRRRHEKKLSLIQADVRDATPLEAAVRKASSVFHLAAQVAVTSSLLDPVYDFSVNAVGTLNLLQAIRKCERPIPLVFTSTNKVYGQLEGMKLRKRRRRYEPVDADLRARGVDETQPLDFCSPYGCSKGAADQYVLDHAKAFGIPACVFRMSCIYGPHQFGTEDQGWLAHFLIQARRGRAITIYGDGCQVRDVLYVGDLVRAFLLAEQNMASISGQAFNIGGGPERTTSLLQLLEEIARMDIGDPLVLHEDWRLGDQPYYVSNTAKFQQTTGWKPAVGLQEGLDRLNHWLAENEKTADLALPPVQEAAA
jgi:CDP-paratose 2-epimerase